MRILTPNQENLLKDERNLLGDLRVRLVTFGASREDQEILAQSIRQLDELFLLVVVGEFNAGKSALINALLGQPVLKEGVTPTTTQINILRHGDTVEQSAEDEHIHVQRAPVEMLNEICIVDTPGTNAIIREHEIITADFVPRADLVLFVTSADRPFTESERAFMSLIRDWGKKVVIVINKVDILETPADLEQVQSFVNENALILFGETVEIFPVSARQALRAKQGEPQLWQESRFEALERYIRQTLDEASRLRLKFLNPLGVGANLVSKFINITQERLLLLESDLTHLADVETQLALYKEDMGRDFDYRMADIENVLYEMEQRGQDYFDETIRLRRVFDLLDKGKIQKEFEQQVVRDSPQRIETKVNELIDWLVDADFRQWQAVMEHLAERRRAHQERIIGDPGVGSFHNERERLIEAVGGQAQRVVETYDKHSEAESIASGAQSAVAALAAVEVGALSLGTLIAVLATTASADLTGVLLASVVATLGLFVIPARRRQAKNEMREKIAAMREQLIYTLRTQFERELNRSLGNIQDAVSPYSRFVRSEYNKLQDSQTELERIQAGMEDLRVRVEAIRQ
jgi:small GTP-binding protein